MQRSGDGIKEGVMICKVMGVTQRNSGVRLMTAGSGVDVEGTMRSSKC